jgi:hypothetical protein
MVQFVLDIGSSTGVDQMSDPTAVQSVINAARLLTIVCSNESRQGGWHNDLGTGEPRTPDQDHKFFPTRIALCHSELSEALEGHRKGIQDDHLPHRLMVEVELADALIRIFDLAGNEL